MLKEIKVPVILGYRVVHRMLTIVTRYGEATALLEVNQHSQNLFRYIKVLKSA
jgi:hypothetical protein